jgi:hypothetical protein
MLNNIHNANIVTKMYYNVLLGIPWQQEMELLQMVYITKAVNHLTKRGDTFANGI